METIDRFAELSGLHINASKSSSYASGTNLVGLYDEATRQGINVGTLPIQYLGHPLKTKVLSKSLC